MIRALMLIALGVFLTLLWQDPANAFVQLENLYDTAKTLVINGVQRLKSGS
jgi:hypothetical protein